MEVGGHRPKLLVCTLLIVQNACSALILSYSRLRPGSTLYLASVLVWVAECIKVPLNLLLMRLQFDSTREFCAALHTLLLADPGGLWRYAVPAVLYTMQNNVTFIGASNLSTATFQVTNQLRIPITALLSVLLLRRRISVQQWIAVLLLMLGVTFVLLRPERPSETFSTRKRSTLVGLAAILFCCFCSGLATVWFERIVKTATAASEAPPSLWGSSMLMATCAMPMALVTMILTDADAIAAHGLWQGMDAVVGAVLLVYLAGGVLVGLTVKVADSVVKTFAVGIALVLSCVGSSVLFGAQLAPMFVAGVGLVFASTMLYALQPLPAHWCEPGAGAGKPPVAAAAAATTEVVPLTSAAASSEQELSLMDGADCAADGHRKAEEGRAQAVSPPG